MSGKNGNSKWFTGSDVSEVVELKYEESGASIGDLTGATITARLLNASGEQIGSAVAQNEAAPLAEWSTAKIEVRFPVSATTAWTSVDVGLGNYLQIKTELSGQTKIYETHKFIEIKEGF